MHLFIFKVPSKHLILRLLAPLKGEEGQKKRPKFDISSNQGLNPFKLCDKIF